MVYESKSFKKEKKQFLKKLHKVAKNYWRTINNIKNKEALELKKIMIRCWITTTKDHQTMI